MLQFLSEQPKTKEGFRNFISTMMAHIAFDFNQKYGFPVEMFEEEMESKAMTRGDQLQFIFNYYSK